MDDEKEIARSYQRSNNVQGDLLKGFGVSKRMLW